MRIPFLDPCILPPVHQASVLYLHPKSTLEGVGFGMDSHICREDVMDFGILLNCLRATLEWIFGGSTVCPS